MSNTVVCAEDVREAKRAYLRKWRAEHPEAVQAAQMRYWTKKAAEMKQAMKSRNEMETEE